MTEQHVHNHYDTNINVEFNQTTRGKTWSLKISNAFPWDLEELIAQAVANLKAGLAALAEEESEEKLDTDE